MRMRSRKSRAKCVWQLHNIKAADYFCGRLWRHGGVVALPRVELLCLSCCVCAVGRSVGRWAAANTTGRLNLLRKSQKLESYDQAAGENAT